MVHTNEMLDHHANKARYSSQKLANHPKCHAVTMMILCQQLTNIDLKFHTDDNQTVGCSTNFPISRV